MKLKNIFIAGLALNLGLSACTGTFLDENTNPNYLTPSTFWKQRFTERIAKSRSLQ